MIDGFGGAGAGAGGVRRRRRGELSGELASSILHMGVVRRYNLFYIRAIQMVTGDSNIDRLGEFKTYLKLFSFVIIYSLEYNEQIILLATV